MENIATDFLDSAGIKMKESADYSGELNGWIEESVIDFEKKDLNPNLWKDKKLKKAAVKQMWEIIDSTLKESGVKRERITAAMIEGSNLTYYYNKYTDIDIHLYIEDVTEEETAIINQAISEFNAGGVLLKDTFNNLELYLMDEAQLKKLNGPRYDLLKEKWLANPAKIKVPVESYKAAIEISLTFARDLDLAVGELKRDIIEYIALDKEIEDMLNVDIKKLQTTKGFKLSEIKADLEALAIKEQSIKDMRRRAYSEEYDPKEETLYYIKAGDADRSYTLNNMIFKILQRFGYVDPLKMLKHGVYKEALEKKDFDSRVEYYLRRIVKVLSLFNNIKLTDKELEL